MKKHICDGIPINTSYCYTPIGLDNNGAYKIKYCRYFKYKKRGKRSQNFSTSGYDCYEYCKLLKKALNIGDMVKDCGIGDDEEDFGELITKIPKKYREHCQNECPNWVVETKATCKECEENYKKEFKEKKNED